jgi:hypothetical protein
MCFPQVMFSRVPAVALVCVLQVVKYPSVDFSYILAVVQIFVSQVISFQCLEQDM